MNKKVLKIIFYWLLVIIWMGVIFTFSSMNNGKSNGVSKGLINNAISKTEKIIEKNNENNKKIVDKLNYPIRKCAHGTIYLILSILILISFINTNEMYKNNIKLTIIITILICFLYACSDEIHQLFVSGRTSSFIDVLIDTFGALVGCLLCKGVLKHEKQS